MIIAQIHRQISSSGRDACFASCTSQSWRPHFTRFSHRPLQQIQNLQKRTGERGWGVWAGSSLQQPCPERCDHNVVYVCAIQKIIFRRPSRDAWWANGSNANVLKFKVRQTFLTVDDSHKHTAFHGAMVPLANDHYIRDNQYKQSLSQTSTWTENCVSWQHRRMTFPRQKNSMLFIPVQIPPRPQSHKDIHRLDDWQLRRPFTDTWRLLLPLLLFGVTLPTPPLSLKCDGLMVLIIDCLSLFLNIHGILIKEVRFCYC